MLYGAIEGGGTKFVCAVGTSSQDVLDSVVLPTAGSFAVRTGARKKNLADIERIVRAELARIATTPPDPAEVERARRYLTTVEARSDSTNAGRASLLEREIVSGRPLRTYEERVARLGAVTPDAIRDLANRLFAGRHLAVLSLR